MPRPLRVLHIAPSHLPLLSTSGGIAVHRHARALAQDGREVSVVICPRVSADVRGVSPERASVGSRVLDGDGFITHRFTAAPGIDDLFALAERLRPSLLHYHHNEYMQIVHTLAERLAVPVVYTDHLPVGDPELAQRKREVGPASAECIRRADRFIVLVEGAIARVAAFSPASVAHTRVVGHGVEDRPEIREVARSRAARRTVNALFVGRLEPEKGIDELIAAMPVALERRAELRFTVVGVRDEPASSWALRLPAALRSRVRFVPWSAPEVVAQEMIDADLLVAPSQFESFGMAVAEAMLYGLPIVATPTEGLSALVGPARCGLFVPRSRPLALAEAIVELAADSELRLDMGRRAAIHAREHLTWAAVTRAMLAVYREIVEFD